MVPSKLGPFPSDLGNSRLDAAPRLLRSKQTAVPETTSRRRRSSNTCLPSASTISGARQNHLLHGRPPSPQSLKHQPRMEPGSGPPLPPTPPNHSRTSLSTRSVSVVLEPTRPTSPGDLVVQLPSHPVVKEPPATPPSRRNPPTPDVTPPVRAWVHVHAGRGMAQPHFPSANSRRRMDTSDEKHAETTEPLPPASEKTSLRRLGRTPSAPVKPTRSKAASTTSVQRTASAPSRPTRLASHTGEAEGRKASTASMGSSTHTVPEAPRADGVPQRQRTLRHVRKQIALREPVPRHPDSIQSPNLPPVTQSAVSDANSHRDTCVSALSQDTSRSISSIRARREIWKSGSIPVVVVPERSSSQGPRSREPSLRSVDSKRSRQTASAASATLRDSGPVFERRLRRDRRYSEPGRLDERTVDFPPTVPVRSSSLSAPTSRTASRAPSTRSTIMSSTRMMNSVPAVEDDPPPKRLESSNAQQEPAPSLQVDLIDVIDAGSPLPALSPLFPPAKTPISVPSMETCITAPELSEALVVHMYQHQNSSILLVNSSGRPSVFLQTLSTDAPQDATQNVPRRLQGDFSPRARMRRTAAVEKSPSTPPQKKPKLLDADSPLRNPRAPPQPPKDPRASDPSAAATARTSRRERLARQERPPRQLDLVWSALSRRRQSVDDAFPGTTYASPGFLTRTLSLTRNRKSEEKGTVDADGQDALSPAEKPTEEIYHLVDLHDDYDRDAETILVYPPVDNRPRPSAATEAAPSRRRRRRRSSSLSAPGRLSPITPPAQAQTPYELEPRPSSADLRAMRRRRSGASLKQSPPLLRRRTISFQPSVSRPGRGIWRSPSGDAAAGVERRFSIGSRLEDVQNIAHLVREKRREKRTQKLRLMISGPREVRDGVGEVIRRSGVYQQFPITHI